LWAFHLFSIMSLDVPDLASSKAFFAGSVDRFSTCVSSFGPVTAVSGVVTEKTGVVTGLVTSVTSSWPTQVFSAGIVVLGVMLMLYGFKMVRPVNFAAGAYAGSTTSLLLLNIFAPTLTNCGAIVGVGVACGLLVGLLCALKRGSVLAVLGLVAGEIIGDVVYKTFLLPLRVPEYGAFFCIGFFAVLCAVIVGQVGDFAVQVACAFFGAYMALTSGLKLAATLSPPPYDAQLLAFGAFKPELSLALADDVDTITGSAFIYGPAIALLVLTAIGTYVQGNLLAASTKPGDMESLIRK